MGDCWGIIFDVQRAGLGLVKKTAGKIIWIGLDKDLVRVLSSSVAPAGYPAGRIIRLFYLASDRIADMASRISG